MAIGTALVDRGRVLKRTSTATVVDGEKQMTSTATPGDWFRCRLFTGSSSEQQGEGRRKEVVRHSMMCGRNAVIDADDEIEIESKQMGNDTFRVDGLPKELRKRRTVIGYEVALVRSE